MKIKVANVEKILTTILMLGTISYMSSFRRPTTSYPLDPIEGGGHYIPSSFDLDAHPDDDIFKKNPFNSYSNSKNIP